jgi:hypothetical protein
MGALEDEGVSPAADRRAIPYRLADDACRVSRMLCYNGFLVGNSHSQHAHESNIYQETFPVGGRGGHWAMSE